MLVDTHKAYEELTAAGADPRLAEAIIQIHQEADEQAATKKDLNLLEQKLIAAMNRRAVALILGTLGGMWGLLELYL